MQIKLSARMTFFILLAASDSAFCEKIRVELDYTLALPNIQIGGQAAHIHTQGLYVDENHIYVTGRLERTPRRPVFLRFERDAPGTFDVIDLSADDHNLTDQPLDHPGGFDFDGKHFWIPIARSRPAGPSLIVRVSRDPTTPFRMWQKKIAFRVDDHIGAIAYEKALGYLYGANWDTKQIHVWQLDGTRTALIDRADWVKDDPNWELAVQDWKAVGQSFLTTPGALIAGGVDKSPQREPSESRAVVELYIPSSRTRTMQIRLPVIDSLGLPVTNEGMCLYDRWLVLLPADIGQNARLYFFKRH